MDYDDLMKMNTHLNAKKTQKPRFTEHPLQENKTQKINWSHKNIIPNMKNAWSKTRHYTGKATSGFQKMGDSLAKNFPNIADGTFDKELFGLESPNYIRRKRK
jgi:hypothetical protein